MSVWVKICGLSTVETVDAAVRAGADAVGFVFAPGSPRTVDVARARELIARVPEHVETVGVFRGQAIEQVLELARASGVSTVQLHGDETAADVAAVRDAGFEVIRAVAVSRHLTETEEARAGFPPCRLLIDAPDPGAGLPFDSAALAADPPAGDWVLAGGLRPDTVAALVADLRPTGVDVSSGVEVSRGIKDPTMIVEFVAAARG